MTGFTCPWVSFPLRDITRKQLRFFAEPPALHFVPSSGFHSLSTVSSALVLAGLFHPAATSRVIFRSGASLPPQPPFLIGRSLPPCHCCIAAPTHGPTFAGSPVSPRTTPLSFEASICARPRSSGPVIHLARSRSPLRISRSSRFSLSRRRPPLSRSPSAHDVTRSMLRSVRAFAFRRLLARERINCEAPHLQARPGKSWSRSSCSTPGRRIILANDRLGVALVSLPAAPFDASIRERSPTKIRRSKWVSRPRASCDAGLLRAAIHFLRSLPTLRCSKTARRFRAHLSVLTSALVEPAPPLRVPPALRGTRLCIIP